MGGRFNVDAGASLTVMNPIAGAAGILHKEGAGTLLLTATNTWGAAGNRIQLHAGTLAFNADENLGAAAADFLVDGNAALHAAGTTTLNSGRAVTMNTNLTVSVTNAATLTIAGVLNESVGSFGVLIKAGAGALILTAVNNYNGATVVEEGTLLISASERIANTTPLRVSGGTVDLQGFNETVAAVTLASGRITASGGTLTGTVYNVESGTISARLGGNGELIKSTGGTATLGAANAYTGGTTINAGTLVVNHAGGSGTGTGIVTVAGGTLGGTGFIAGAVTVNSGGAIAPGVSVGTLTVGALNLASGAAATIEFGGGSNDVVVVSNTNGLIIGSGVGVSLDTEGGTNAWTADGLYKLFQYTGALGGAGAAGLSVLNPQPGTRYGFGAANGWVYVVINSGPIISAGNASVAEGNAGLTNLVFTLDIGTPFGADVSVNFATADGMAKSAFNDYVSTNGSVTIPAGATDTQIVVWVTGDTKFEGNETLTVILTNASNAVILSATMIGTIIDDDSQGGIWYVDDTATGVGNGRNWDDAFTNLQAGLTAGTAGNEIWVAEGTYQPGATAASTFQLKANVPLRGGFAGGESSVAARVLHAHPSILDGDIGTGGFDADNIRRMVTGVADGTIDGFRIRGNYAAATGDSAVRVANIGPMTIRNCVFSNNVVVAGDGGSCIYKTGAPALSVERCAFYGNVVAGSAINGAVVLSGANDQAVVKNSLFSGNRFTTAASFGSTALASVRNPSAPQPLVVNCTFNDNMAHPTHSESASGGVIGVGSAGGTTGSMRLRNCVLRGTNTQLRVIGDGNTYVAFKNCAFPAPDTIAFPYTDPTVWFDITSDTAVSVSITVLDEGGHVYTDPLLLDADGNDDVVGTLDDDLRLQAESPCIDAGTATDAALDDYLGVVRPLGATFDIGAYEGGVVTGPPTGMLMIVR